jgi:cytochrome c-type biogenesis protein CcmI
MSEGGVIDPDALAALEEQRAFLRRSLADLDREHDAGDLDDTDFASLRADYERRLAAVSAAVDEGRATFAAVPRSGGSRRAVVVALVVLFALGCGVAVAQLAGRRTAGAGISGDSQVTTAGKLKECLATATEGNAALAGTVACYDSVLQRDPANVEALTYKAGIQLMASGDTAQITALIDVATKHPEYPDVHAFLAVALERIGRPDSALAELKKLDALHPTPFITDLVGPLRQRLEAAVAPTTTTAPN